MAELEEDSTGETIATDSAAASDHAEGGPHPLLVELDSKLATLTEENAREHAIVAALTERAGALRLELTTTLARVNGSGLPWDVTKDFGKRIKRLGNDAKQQARESRGDPQAAERARQKVTMQN